VSDLGRSPASYRASLHTGGNTPPEAQIVIFRTGLFRQGTTPARFAERPCPQSPTATDHRICARAHATGETQLNLAPCSWRATRREGGTTRQSCLQR
jgi:hypothetical protein